MVPDVWHAKYSVSEMPLGMDKEPGLETSVLFYCKTANAALLQNGTSLMPFPKLERKPRPTVLNNTGGVLASSLNFRNYILLSFFKFYLYMQNYFIRWYPSLRYISIHPSIIIIAIGNYIELSINISPRRSVSRHLPDH